MLLEFRFPDFNLDWAPFGRFRVDLERLLNDRDGPGPVMWLRRPLLDALMPLVFP